MLRPATPGNAASLPPSAWWVRLLSRLPFAALYLLADCLGWLAFRVFPHRDEVVRGNLALCFPELDPAAITAIRRGYYGGFADVLVEVIKSATLPAEEIRRRVRIVGTEQARALMEQGQSVLLAAAHQCNWEWMLLALSLELGYPLDAAYKPLVDSWAEREMKKVRSRFGSRLIPAKELLADIIRRGKVVRAIAMVADQEPTTSEHKHWTPVSQPRHRLCRRDRRDRARHALPRVLHRHEAHGAWILRDALHAALLTRRATATRRID